METLNIAGKAGDESDTVTEVTALHLEAPAPATLLLMLDIESLSLGARPVITQIALLGYDLEEDELLPNSFSQYLPVDPQLQLIPARKISASTINWWMTQGDDARSRFEFSTSTDFEDLPAIMRGLINAFNMMTSNGAKNYELCAKGPQFDVVAVETLLEECGLEVPWKYDRVTDLRTDLRRAGINPKNVPMPDGTIPHVAYWDARWQIEQFLVARRTMAGGRV